MKRTVSKMLWALGAALVLGNGNAAASIVMDGRLILADAPVKAEIADAPVVAYSFTAPDKVDYTQTVFALEVTLAEGALPGATILLNGLAVDSWPIPVGDTWLLRIPVAMIHAGENELRIEGPQVASAKSLRIFSLDGSFEDIHFERAFGAPDKWTKAQPTPHPTQAMVDALHYDLSITISHANTAISGTLVFTGEVLQDGLTSFALDFSRNSGSMVVSSVDQGPSTAAVPFAFNGNFLVMTLPRTYNTGEQLVLRIDYAGTPASGGAFGSPYVRGTHGSAPSTPIVYTFSEPYGARAWWPCKDLPDDKALMDIRVTSAKPYTTVSNGTLVSREDLGATERWHYHTDFPMPTYLVAICSTNYAYASTVYTALDGNTTMEIGHYVLPQNLTYEAPGAAGTLDTMNFLAQTFGEYPYLTHKYTTATHLSGSGMEHTTMTSMPGRDVGVATGSSEPGKGRRNVHELAHHWFGDDLTCRTFDHLWLNEGFATWCEPLYYENEYGIESYHAYVNAWSVSDTGILVSSSADSFAGTVVYRRGGTVLHMLRNVLGKEELLAGMRLYLNRHRASTVVTDDFQQALEDSSGEDLDWFFDQWVYQPGRPTYAWSYDTSRQGEDNILTLSIAQTQSSPMPNVYTMPIDIVLSDLAGNTRTERVLNNARTQQIQVNVGTFEPWTVELDPMRWILKYEAASTSATPPVIQSILSENLGWSVDTASSFDVITSTDGVTWRVLDFPPGNARSMALGATAGLSTGQTHWLQLRSKADGLRPSTLTNAYAYRSGTGPRLLVVEGYDRWSTQSGRGTNHPFAATTGVAIGAAGYAFDTCDNALVEDGTVNLANYDAVVWILGEESTAQETFSSTEQSIVAAYLNGGGKLLVSGAEVAYDLGRSASSSADKVFLNTYLKATYEDDDSNSYTAQGVGGGPLENVSLSYDDGTAGIYRAEYPDVLGTINGSTEALLYGNGLPAAIQYSGTFPGGTVPGKLVFIGFGFETIYPATSRDEVMARILDFFELPPPARVGDNFLLY